MTRSSFLFLAFLFTAHLCAQDMNVDSLELLLKKSVNQDTTKAKLIGELAYRYSFSQPDKGLQYSQQDLELSKRLNFKRGIADSYHAIAWCLWSKGSYNISLQMALRALHLYEELENKERVAFLYLAIANIYRDIGDYRNALSNSKKSIQLYNTIKLSAKVPIAVAGSVFELQNNLDSALIYVKKAYELDVKEDQGKWGWLQYLLGNIYEKRKDYNTALGFYRTALPLALNSNFKKDIGDIYNGIATVYYKTENLDSSIYYANEVLEKQQLLSYEKGVLNAVNILVKDYKKKNNSDSTIKYLELSEDLNNQLFNQEKQRDIQNLAFNEQLRQDEIDRERLQYLNKLKLYALLTIGMVISIIAILQWRSNKQKQKAYALLKKQKEETDLQKSKVEKTLIELKLTQAQLIQSEKMASLGELTAGIAHEIQNPLNFVNNFSEVNTELLYEMKQELKAGNSEEAIAIANDLEQNLQKINHHGKRADAIVKGMLQHSRASSGKKEPTDINALADEYLRLSYHGLRAKDKSFNADFKTNFDESIGKIEVVPQDIGRVLLNLFNNAFYAVNEKKKQVNGTFEPTVSVSTKKVDNKVEISVKDNGVGIPQKVVDKIFQPFFTTKPTGQGTGLGLSMSYDIIKAHGGELNVETKEGEGAEFIIQLPWKANI